MRLLLYRLKFPRCATSGQDTCPLSWKLQLGSVTKPTHACVTALLCSRGWGGELRCLIIATRLCTNEIVLCVQWKV